MIKDPDATLPFTVDWSRWLVAEEDQADTAEWFVPDGLTLDFPSLADGKATAWLSGGEDRTTYPVVCRLTTIGGRTDERTIHVSVRHR